MKRSIGTLGLAALVACSASAEKRPQWLVHVSTDATVPQMGDRVLVELLQPTGDALACSDCRRLFGADSPQDLPFELGVAPSSSDPTARIRARLMRSAALDGIGPDPGAAVSIDRIARLEEPSPDAHVSLRLAMACFGIAADPAAAASCDPGTGVLSKESAAPRLENAGELQSGAWSAALEEPCTDTPDNHEVCVPGGAFLLGDLDGIGSYDVSPATTPERLVRIRPFFLDRDEYTLQRWNALVASGLAPTLPPGHGPDCTHASGAGGDPALPMNCVSHALATLICEAEGGRLPTEAEWEFAASNRVLETRYPWGSDPDVCAHAVVARSYISTCLITPQGTLPQGLVPSGTADDLTLIGIRDLGGNVAEWVDGTGASYDDPCFGPADTLLTDPRCDSVGYLPVARGGHWQGLPSSARSTSRAVHDSFNASVGFRCARSDSLER